MLLAFVVSLWPRVLHEMRAVDATDPAPFFWKALSSEPGLLVRAGYEGLLLLAIMGSPEGVGAGAVILVAFGLAVHGLSLLASGPFGFLQVLKQAAIGVAVVGVAALLPPVNAILGTERHASLDIPREKGVATQARCLAGQCRCGPPGEKRD